MTIPWPGEASIIKMWDSLVDKGIGGLLEPWQIRRVGKAETDARAYDLLKLTEAEQQCALLKGGTHQLVGDKLLPLTTPSESKLSAEQSVLLPEQTIRALGQRLLADEFRKEINVAKAIRAAEEELKSDISDASEEPLNDDWLYRWRDYASGISSEGLQSLWGKILAEECKSSGSVSLRTMDFIRNLSLEESRLISEIAPFVTDNFIFLSSIVTSNVEVTFELLHNLEQLGILSGAVTNSLLFTLSTEDTPTYEGRFTGTSKALHIVSDNYIKPLDIPVYFLTKIGDELVQLCKIDSNAMHFDQFAHFMRLNGFNAEISSL